jgi:hypothetical protein
LETRRGMIELRVAEIRYHNNRLRLASLNIKSNWS